MTATLDITDTAAVRRFIVDNTKHLHPPLTPEITLHLAEESLAIWRKTEEDLEQLNIAPPYWAFAWAGGQALARYLLDTPALVQGRDVLDLGTGSGLTAIAAMKAGARSVLAADIDPMALIATALNAETNGVAVTVTAEDFLQREPAAHSVILIGDLFYERQLADRVIAYIEAAAQRGTLSLIGDPQRNYFPKGKFAQATTYKVPVTRDLEDSEIKNAAVWRFGG
jgi:predicted nicotinamide N-methyase